MFKPELTLENILNSLFADGSRGYRIPWQPEKEDEVRLLLRVLCDSAAAVWLVTEKGRFEMKKERSEGCFDFYGIVLPPAPNMEEYYFSLDTPFGQINYTAFGAFASGGNPERRSYFKLPRGFKVPDWAVGTVMYQIFVD
ncbi:MAG: hypothetical protein IJC39_02905, partial [Firmicutes bacterium]|nr:hypothetical protein [Bacillota bacterium]